MKRPEPADHERQHDFDPLDREEPPEECQRHPADAVRIDRHEDRRRGLLLLGPLGKPGSRRLERFVRGCDRDTLVLKRFTNGLEVVVEVVCV